MNSDHPAPTAEEREENECVRCYATMGIPYGLEPTEVCNLCAQEERLALKAQLAENDAKIAGLEHYGSLCPAHHADMERGHMPSTTCVRCLLTKATSARYAAESSLRAVSEALEEKLATFIGAGATWGHYVHKQSDVEALFARIRSILDSK